NLVEQITWQQPATQFALHLFSGPVGMSAPDVSKRQIPHRLVQRADDLNALRRRHAAVDFHAQPFGALVPHSHGCSWRYFRRLGLPSSFTSSICAFWSRPL